MIFSLRVQMLEDKGNCRARRLLPLTAGRSPRSATHAEQRNKEDGKIRSSHEEIRTRLGNLRREPTLGQARRRRTRLSRGAMGR